MGQEIDCIDLHRSGMRMNHRDCDVERDPAKAMEEPLHRTRGVSSRCAQKANRRRTSG